MSRPYKKRMVEDDDSDDDVAPAKASRAASSSKRRKVDDEDEEDEEGQVSDDDEEGELPEERERPQPSAPQEPPEDYNSADEYDGEFYKSQEDRQEVENMTEIDREMLMADRYDKQMRRNEVLEIREKAREKREGRKPAGRESKKRMETANDKSNKMREIAALRKDKEKRKQEESERNQARRKSSRDDDDDDDDDDEEAGPSRSRREDEEAQRRQEQRKRAQEEVKEVSAVPSDLERVRLTRQKLEQWLTEPFFDTVVVGCFVRINVGEKAGIPVYRVAEVVGVKDGFRKYQLGHTMTGKRLELQIGTSNKTFEMSYISGKNFEQDELSKYTNAQQHGARRGGARFKFKREIEEKVAELKSCKTHVYTNEEVTSIVEGNKQNGLMKGNLAQRRIEYQVKLDAARESGKVDEVEAAEAAMATLVGKIGTAKQIDHKVGAGSFKIQDINMRNQEFQYAVEDARGDIALKKERAMSAGTMKATDPFARLPMRPVSYYNTSKPEAPKALEPPRVLSEMVQEAAAPALAVDVSYRSLGEGDPTSPGFADLATTPRGTAAGWATEDDGGGKGATLTGARASAHDVEFDIDLAAPASVAPRPRPVAPRPSPAATAVDPTAPASGTARLSVSDYKRRAGIA